MTQDEILLAEIRRDEGVVPHAYQDSLGFWTIGVGRLIDKRKGGRLTDDEINYLLTNDIDRFVATLDANAPWWRQMNHVRQRVLVNMAFNLGWGNGKSGLSAFKATLGAMERGDYTAAAKGMRNSKWASQVGKRADRLIKMMETGNEPG